MRAAFYLSAGFWLAVALIMLAPGWVTAALCFLGIAVICVMFAALCPPATKSGGAG